MTIVSIVTRVEQAMDHSKASDMSTTGRADSDCMTPLAVGVVAFVLLGHLVGRAMTHATQDFQMDYFGLWDGFRIFLAGASPYFNTPAHYSRLFSDSLNSLNRYPPAAFALAWLGLLSYAKAKLVWTGLLFAGLVVQLVVVWRYMGKPAVLLLLCLMMGFPIEFAMQRGQIDLLIATLTTVYVMAYLHGHRRVGLSALAVAASMKIVPGMLLVLPIVQRDWRSVRYFAGIMLAINLVAAAVTSLIYPGMLPDFARSISIGDQVIASPQPMPGIQQQVQDNRLLFETDMYRFSLNYYGSYGSVALHYMVNKLTRWAWDIQLHAYAVSLLGVLTVMWINWRSHAFLCAARLLMAYCILNPLAWGTGLAVLLTGAVIVFQLQRTASGQVTWPWRVPVIVIFWLLVAFLMAPRMVPWYRHEASEMARCGAVVILVVVADPDVLFKMIRWGRSVLTARTPLLARPTD